MKFYTKQHPCYGGINLHARYLYVCILDQNGKIVLHKNIKTQPDALFKTITPFRDNLLIGVKMRALTLY